MDRDAQLTAIIGYVRYMLTHGGGRARGVEPAGFYLRTLYTAIGPALIPLAAGARMPLRD